MAEFLPSEFIVKHGAATYNEDKSKWVIDIEPKEQIVRCADCVNVDEEYYGTWGRIWHCEKFGEVGPDGFCAWGERKEGGDD